MVLSLWIHYVPDNFMVTERNKQIRQMRTLRQWIAEFATTEAKCGLKLGRLLLGSYTKKEVRLNHSYEVETFDGCYLVYAGL